MKTIHGHTKHLSFDGRESFKLSELKLGGCGQNLLGSKFQFLSSNFTETV